MPPTGDLACNPGMCPDWESNQRYFGLQAGAQPTESHQVGLDAKFSNILLYLLHIYYLYTFYMYVSMCVYMYVFLVDKSFKDQLQI